MATWIKMPSLGQSMEEGTIVRWLKAEGDTVAKGEALYEVMTDKVTIEVEATEGGVVRKILAQTDALVPVGDDVAIIGTATESIEEKPAAKDAPAEAAPAVISLAAVPSAAAFVATASSPVAASNGRVHATPLARRCATDHGVDIAALVGLGSGPDGRILKRDVLTYAELSPAPAAQPVAANGAKPAAIVGAYNVVPLAGMRKMVADALTKSASNPHVTLTIPVDMTEAAKLRQQILPVIEKSLGVRVSYTDLIALAVARVLPSHPFLNSTLEGNEIRQHSSVHLGIAVSLGADGLIVPVLRDANVKSLGAISSELKGIVGRARAGKLAADEVSGGTFSITNLGTYGVTQFNPIINPPQAAILGVCTITDTIVPVDGHPEVRPMMNLCLSFDHRITDGAPAAAFLAQLKETLEKPYLLIA